MSRIRDIANLFSGSTDAATDAEVTAAIASHNSATTSVHGISNTANLATQAYVQANKGIQSGNTSSRPNSPSNGDVYSNTQTGFLEVYSSTYGWEQIGGIASSVTDVSATNSSSGRAYNNGAASVSFTPGTILGRSYTVTSSPGGYTATGSSSPVTITGLQSNTSYTYTIVATNNYGSSSASSASSAVTATTIPQAPTIGTATVSGATGATLTFTAGATGGSAITNYKYSTDGVNYTAFSPAQTTSPLTITGLTSLQNYTFYIKAVNANGDSSASSASNSIFTGASVSGGTLTSDSTYYYRTFTSNGTLTVTGSLTADVMLGAGGGGGNGGSGGQYGGAGAGGVVVYSNASLTSGTYAASIGAGGAYKQSPTVAGGPAGNGSSTTLGSFGNTVGGGGAGSYAYDTTTGKGANGGSGGGGGGMGGNEPGPSGGTATQGSGSGYTGYGNNGGKGSANGAGGAGGGGGGAGGVGADAVYGAAGNASGNGGSGGNGISNQFTGLQAWLSTAGIGQNVSGTYYFAGGGSGAYGLRDGYGGGNYPSGGSSGGNSNGSSGIVTVRYLKSAVGE